MAWHVQVKEHSRSACCDIGKSVIAVARKAQNKQIRKYSEEISGAQGLNRGWGRYGRIIIKSLRESFLKIKIEMFVQPHEEKL